mgnify:FL=1
MTRKEREENIWFVNHEFRQPICTLRGLVELLQMQKSRHPEEQHIIDLMEGLMARMDENSRKMLSKLQNVQDKVPLE